MFEGIRIAAIGKPTASMLSSKNLRTDIMPDRSTFRCLLEEIESNMKIQKER